jgi:hypothetical protein
MFALNPYKTSIFPLFFHFNKASFYLVIFLLPFYASYFFPLEKFEHKHSNCFYFYFTKNLNFFYYSKSDIDHWVKFLIFFTALYLRKALTIFFNIATDLCDYYWIDYQKMILLKNILPALDCILILYYLYE